MIKYNASNNVISPFNPILALHPQMRKEVNEHFIQPILEVFFKDKKGASGELGIENFEALDADRLKTEMEFQKEDNYVQNYVYAELIKEIRKDNEGKIIFKPRYSISFDWDLTTYYNRMDRVKKNLKNYPYKQIFKDLGKEEKQIRYGTLRLGEVPILYVIFIDFQEVLRFIKKREINLKNDIEFVKVEESPKEKKERLFDSVIQQTQRKLRETTDSLTEETLKQQLNRLTFLLDEPLQGTAGKLRVNLAWNTTDDLDLHIETPNGKIFYGNKVVEYQGVIGELDVDKNAGGEPVSNPQENINWDSMPVGRHIIKVHFFKSREQTKVPFTITVLNENGDGRIYNSYVEAGTLPNKKIASFIFENDTLIFEDLV